MNKEHPNYITISEGGAGWFAVMIWWNPDLGGFPEPWESGIGRYPDKERAIQEAKEWADAEGLEFRLTPA